MWAAIITGLFGVLPVVMLYGSSRRRQLNLIKSEVEIAGLLPKDQDARRHLDRVIAEHVNDYVEHEAARKRPTKEAKLWLAAWVVAYVLAASTYVLLFLRDLEEPLQTVMVIVGMILAIATAYSFGQWWVWRRVRRPSQSV